LLIKEFLTKEEKNYIFILPMILLIIGIFAFGVFIYQCSLKDTRKNKKDENYYLLEDAFNHPDKIDSLIE